MSTKLEVLVKCAKCAKCISEELEVLVALMHIETNVTLAGTYCGMELVRTANSSQNLRSAFTVIGAVARSSLTAKEEGRLGDLRVT